MSELTFAILSSAVWDVIKTGASITKEYLKKKLSKWILDDEALERIKDTVNNAPDLYLKSEGLLKEYLKLNEDICNILRKTKSSNISVQQDIKHNTGNVIGVVHGGTIINNNYSNVEEPQITHKKPFLLTSGFNRFRPIQVVKSYSSTRDSCSIDNNSVNTIRANFFIPKELKTKNECHFAMVLLAYTPSLNLINYFDDNYCLEFFLNMSPNINLVQLQIKNSNQYQFVDAAISNGYFRCALSEISDRNSWKDVKEICFTIFADDNYITGEEGYLEIRDIKLTN